MKALGTLATTALLGTERRPPALPVRGGALGELLEKLPSENVEKRLLQSAGVLGTCQLAGWLPPAMTAPPPPAKPEAGLNPQAPPALSQTLAGIFTEGPVRLQAEALRRLATAGHAVPHRLLPRALDCGRRSVALREFLLPVMGERGAWLAAQNEAWSFAAGGDGPAAAVADAQAWEHGSLDQRRLFLTELRKQNASQGRDLVKAALATEGARERTAFIECLANGLSLEDEDLLEAVLKDKSKEARQAALRLLSSLPASRLMQRMAARVQPLLKVEKKFLRGTVATLEAPAAYAPEWKDDLIEEPKPKGLSLGGRAWWLLQIVRATPLAWWEEQTGMNPAELIAWAAKTDWKDALLQGWAGAQELQRRVEWAEGFLTSQIPPGTSLNAMDLLATLPMALREKHFLSMLEKADPKQMVTSILLDRFLAGIPLDAPAFSAATARSVLRLLKHHINSGAARYDWQLRATLPELACVMPPELFDECAGGWEITREEAQPFAEAVARLGIVLDQRRQIHAFKSAS